MGSCAESWVVMNRITTVSREGIRKLDIQAPRGTGRAPPESRRSGRRDGGKCTTRRRPAQRRLDLTLPGLRSTPSPGPRPRRGSADLADPEMPPGIMAFTVGGLRRVPMAASTTAWIESAADDFDVAEAMFDSGRWSYVAFMCHQCLEKLLKAAVYDCAASIPPPTHNLGSLLKLTGLQVPANIRTSVLRVNPHYMTARYPDAAGGRPADAYDRSLAAEVRAATIEVRDWLAEHLKSTG
ncbi:MAG: hypothetical protein COS65_28905 [Armatimonadetes bacterium CG06_land_8_20_14_3_00_66_21]|nr:MAG: hypothetical protein COS65_28905 [Armatimonadetes bacterium CG06_land_8_20_14_3_00_66_21]PIX41301.1 MAG: hypothetical protein COZ57_23805 [Armatimonadetes bacterium CG_4_8_14_3_um_filter_66_20]